MSSFDVIRSGVARASRLTPDFPGKTRFLRHLDGRLRLTRRLLERVSNVNWSLDTTDLIDFNTLYRGGHDSSVRSVLQQRLLAARRPVLWDIGSNVGAVCLPLLARIETLAVHAFEPSPSVNARLRANARLNPALAPRLTIHDCALSNQCGDVSFFVSAEEFNSGVGTLYRSHNVSDVPIRARAETGMSLIAQGVDVPTAIKIDVEGFEWEVLGGLLPVLNARQVPCWVIEHSPYRLIERGVTDKTRIPSLLTAAGYVVKALLGDGTVRTLTPDLLEEEMDLLATL